MKNSIKNFIIKSLRNYHHAWDFLPDDFKSDSQIIKARLNGVAFYINESYKQFQIENDYCFTKDFNPKIPEDLYENNFINKEIQKIILKKLNKYHIYYGNFKFFIEVRLKDDFDFQKKLIDLYVKKIISGKVNNYALSVPNKIKNHPDILNARISFFTKLALSGSWVCIPEEIKKHKDVINAIKQCWIINLQKGNYDIKDAPKELMDDPDVIEAYRKSLLKKLESVKK